MLTTINDNLVLISLDDDETINKYSDDGWSGGAFVEDSQFFYKD